MEIFMVLHLNKLESTLPKDALFQVCARFIKRRNLRLALRYANRLTPIFSWAQIPFHQIAHDQS